MRCGKGDSSPHGIIPLVPKTSASTNSAISARYLERESNPHVFTDRGF